MGELINSMEHRYSLGGNFLWRNLICKKKSFIRVLPELAKFNFQGKFAEFCLNFSSE
jgi:hypothetical protein